MKKLRRSGRWNFRRLTWPLWGKEDVQEGFDIVERFKGLIVIWLELDIWDFAQETAREYHDHTLAAIQEAAEEQRIDHDEIFQSVRDIAQHQEQYYSATERDMVIECWENVMVSWNARSWENCTPFNCCGTSPKRERTL
ncbi:hypothetical protein MSAN_02480300 [Mycena sanguinolenta]|uniref:Uncharacterized protein n=1 Tax=Mycena sanguinolenta TaxID=230812 RepID=A0A8H6U402_9AGAR|nr:hypothetical protein MSAN_02480300 [Mycena sanguinolenta]